MLQAVESGDAKAAHDLLPLVYSELRRLAFANMARQPAGHTLQATALVHEAYLRLVASETSQPRWEHRGHFFAAAAEAMRHVLVDRARRKCRAKHGGGQQRVECELDAVQFSNEADGEKVILVHEALDQLAEIDPLKAEIVKLHYFVGLTHEETAQALNLSEKTVRRHWNYAKTWLYRCIQENR